MDTFSLFPREGALEAGAARLLMRSFGGRWQIEYDAAMRVWTGERREGNSLRFMVAHRAAELAAKIDAAEAQA